MTDTKPSTGSCLCGGVRFAVNGPLRDVVNCHCGQCRKVHGHYAAYTAAAEADIEWLEKESLVWFESTPGKVRRGFCSRCGASLFWWLAGRGSISIAAGVLDAPTGLKTIRHIYVAHAGDYYELPDTLEKLPGSMF